MGLNTRNRYTAINLPVGQEKLLIANLWRTRFNYTTRDSVIEVIGKDKKLYHLDWYVGWKKDKSDFVVVRSTKKVCTCQLAQREGHRMWELVESDE